MNSSIHESIVPPPRGLEREEPEIGQEDDIPTDDDHGSAANTPPAPTPAPPATPNPQPRHPEDPEKGHVEEPGEGKSEHPKV
jgi:hypothetical protein